MKKERKNEEILERRKEKKLKEKERDKVERES